FAFQVKTALTALRGALAGTAQIGLASEAAVLSALLSRDVGGYADFIVVRDGAPVVAAALAGELARAKASLAAPDPSQPAVTDRFAQDVQVVASRSLNVAEIIAR